MKKLFKVGMAITTTLLLATNVLASSFSDIPSGAWYEGSVNYLTSSDREVQVISGYTDGTFRPNDTLTVEQFLVLVNRALGNEFDTSNENISWSAPYVSWALSKNWITENDYKNQTDDISRELMAKVLVNAVESRENLQYRDENVIANLIPDYNSTNTKYKEFVVKAYDTGLITGDENGNFKGSNTLTRAEASIIVRRILDKDFRSPAEEIVEVPNNEDEIIFDEIKDVNEEGAMKMEKAEEYILQAVENTKIFTGTDGKAFVRIDFPELPSGFEWRFSVDINHTDGLSGVRTHVVREDDDKKIFNSGHVYEELRGFTSVGTIKTADVRYWIESIDNVDKYGRGIDEGYAQVYQIVNEMIETGSLRNSIAITIDRPNEAPYVERVEYNYGDIFEWWSKF